MATPNQVAASPVAAVNYKSLVRSAALKQIGLGLLWAGVGVGITLATSGNFIFFGPVIYGAYLAVKGLYRLATA